MALIPPHFIDTVVALGIGDPKKEVAWVATGFFYGRHVGKDPTGQDMWRVYLVSNRHVLEGHDKLWIRCNPKAGEAAQIFRIRLVDADGNFMWYSSDAEGADVAVASINAPVLMEKGMKFDFFTDNGDGANIEKMNELGITEGDFAYTIGFPFGLVGRERNFAIIRGGPIARMRDLLVHAETQFLVDSVVFPGNSGGPVIYKPDALAVQGTKSVNRSYLIGVVTGYLTYRDVAISRQTGQDRVVFEENSGLASVQPVDLIEEAVAKHWLTLDARERTLAGSGVSSDSSAHGSPETTA